jgi:hypothetical protein
VRAKLILRRVLDDVAAEIHNARLRALTAGVMAVVRGHKLSLTALGRAMADKTGAKHGIKRADRLLGNGALFDELELIYGAIARYVIRRVKEPIVLVDWTEVGIGRRALTAAVPVAGRAIPIATITVPASQEGSPVVHAALLAMLHRALPKDCKPILVTDAGFRTRWLRSVQAYGWNFVARLRGPTQVRRDAEPWQRWSELFPLARRRPRSLGSYHLGKTKKQPLMATLVTVDRRSRATKRPTKHPQRRHRQQRAARANREPWLLATSLPQAPDKIVALYERRMMIEETFRDLKSAQFGWGLESARSRSEKRVAIQLLLFALAELVSLLIGLGAERQQLHRILQANTRKQRVLSLVTVGRMLIARNVHVGGFAPPLDEFVGIR